MAFKERYPVRIKIVINNNTIEKITPLKFKNTLD